MRSRAVFLNRDGTIARDVNYRRRVEDFEILPGVPESIRLLNENGFKVVVITNQPGIAQGYFSEGMLAQIHNKMESQIFASELWRLKRRSRLTLGNLADKMGADFAYLSETKTECWLHPVRR